MCYIIPYIKSKVVSNLCCAVPLRQYTQLDKDDLYFCLQNCICERWVDYAYSC